MEHRWLRRLSDRGGMWPIGWLALIVLGSVLLLVQRNIAPRSEHSLDRPHTAALQPPRGDRSPEPPRNNAARRPLAVGEPDRTVLTPLAPGDVAISPAPLERTDLHALQAQLERSDLGERMSAVEHMRGRDEPAVLETLRRTLDDPDPDVRRAAFRAVVDLAAMDQSAELTSALRRALSDADARVRIDVLDALADRGADGLAAIREAAADPVEDVGAYARHLLERGLSTREDQTTTTHP